MNLQASQILHIVTNTKCCFLDFLVVITIGNHHVFMGPDDLNGYGFLYMRLCWTGFGLQANIVEEYVLLSALLH